MTKFERQVGRLSGSGWTVLDAVTERGINMPCHVIEARSRDPERPLAGASRRTIDWQMPVECARVGAARLCCQFSQGTGRASARWGGQCVSAARPVWKMDDTRPRFACM